MQNDPENSIQSWYKRIGFGTKFIMITPITLFLIEYILNIPIEKNLIDIPYFVIHSFEIQRLFFAQFIEMSLFGVIIIPLMFNMWVNVEQQVGTAVFVVDFFIKSFLIQVIYVFMTIIFQITYFPSFGLWNVIFVYIILECIANPERERRLFFFPCVFKNRVFPFAIFGLGFLFSQRIAIDQIAAAILAAIEARYFNFMIFRPSQGFVQKMENFPPFSFFNKRYDFALNRTNFYVGRAQVNEPSLPVQDQAVPWSGKGVTIGTSQPQINIANQDYGIQGQ